jgi:hypothetical protein
VSTSFTAPLSPCLSLSLSHRVFPPDLLVGKEERRGRIPRARERKRERERTEREKTEREEHRERNRERERERERERDGETWGKTGALPPSSSQISWHARINALSRISVFA